MSDVEDEFLTITQAAELLGVARMTFWRRLKEGVMPVYRSGRDHRVRLVRRADVEALVRPQLIEVDEGKEAA
jgi:excisionase family DNA binding protein